MGKLAESNRRWGCTWLNIAELLKLYYLNFTKLASEEVFVREKISE